MKIQKKMKGGSGGGRRVGLGVRVDVNEEFKFLEKFTKKNSGGGSGGWASWGGGVGLVGGQGGCEPNVRGRGDVGYGGRELRIEGIVKCTKRYCTILKKNKKKMWWGGGRGNI